MLYRERERERDRVCLSQSSDVLVDVLEPVHEPGN